MGLRHFWVPSPCPSLGLAHSGPSTKMLLLPLALRQPGTAAGLRPRLRPSPSRGLISVD